MRLLRLGRISGVFRPARDAGDPAAERFSTPAEPLVIPGIATVSSPDRPLRFGRIPELRFPRDGVLPTAGLSPGEGVFPPPIIEGFPPLRSGRIPELRFPRSLRSARPGRDSAPPAAGVLPGSCVLPRFRRAPPFSAAGEPAPGADSADVLSPFCPGRLARFPRPPRPLTDRAPRSGMFPPSAGRSARPREGSDRSSRTRDSADWSPSPRDSRPWRGRKAFLPSPFSFRTLPRSPRPALRGPPRSDSPLKIRPSGLPSPIESPT